MSKKSSLDNRKDGEKAWLQLEMPEGVIFLSGVVLVMGALSPVFIYDEKYLLAGFILFAIGIINSLI